MSALLATIDIVQTLQEMVREKPQEPAKWLRNTLLNNAQFVGRHNTAPTPVF